MREPKDDGNAAAGVPGHEGAAFVGLLNIIPKVFPENTRTCC